MDRDLVLFPFFSIPTRHKNSPLWRHVALVFKYAIFERGVYFHSSNGEIIDMQLLEVES